MTRARMTHESKIKGRILYVEDNEDCRQVLVTLLGFVGYKVVTANNVADGLRRARFESFDLLILADRYIDGRSVDLCRGIRAFDSDIPIMFYSTAAYKTDIEAGMAAGAQSYMIKPTGIESIEHTVGILLQATT